MPTLRCMLKPLGLCLRLGALPPETPDPNVTIRNFFIAGRPESRGLPVSVSDDPVVPVKTAS
jgi:hypothetical protein